MFILSSMSKVYQKRKVENISEPIVFNGFKLVIKMIFTLLAMFGTATITVHIAVARPLFVITLLLGSLVGYIFAGIILKEARISWKNYRAYIGYCTALLVGLLGVYFYAPTYNYAIPEVSEVSEVTIESDFLMDTSQPYLATEILEVFTLSEPESIETITEMNKQFVDQKEVSYPSDGDYPVDFSFTYELENGRDVSRTYYYADIEAYEKFYTEVTNLPEFRENICVFLDTVVRESTEQIEMNFFDEIEDPSSETEIVISSSDTELYNSFIDALIADAKIKSELSRNGDHSGSYQVRLSSKSGGYSVWLNSECVNTIQWFEDNGYAEEASLLKEDVDQ